MDKAQAEKLLGLDENLNENGSVDEINKAYQDKIDKLNSATTDALKTKFSAMRTTLEEAKTLLLAPSEFLNSPPLSNDTASSSSSLTQSKRYDLAGIGPGNSAKFDLKAGTVLVGRYIIEKQISVGGIGSVFSAIDSHNNQQVAIKMMPPALVNNIKVQKIIMGEARISQQLSHPNIVNVYDVRQDGNSFFLTMELLEGQTLSSYLKNLKNIGQLYQVEDALALIINICKALHYAHKYTVHKDIHPKNIWLCNSGKIKVMGFGLAYLQNAGQRTNSGDVLEVPYYMAPEKIKGLDNIDGRADQFSIGVMLYEMLSGDIPTGRIESLHLLNKKVSKKLSLAVDRLLSNKPEQRFSDMNDVINAIKEKKGGPSLPSFNVSKPVISTTILIAILGVAGLASTGALDSLWNAIKSIDKTLVVQQQEVIAKLQGEIQNYLKRFDKGQRNLNSDVLDAQRSNDSKLKFLEHWKRLTDDYLFDSSDLAELEKELSKGTNLAIRGQQENIPENIKQVSNKKAITALTQVRDGYKQLWAQFNAAEYLLQAEEKSNNYFQQWDKRKRAYKLDNPFQARDAAQNEEQAKQSQLEGDFVSALDNWQAAKKQWQDAYRAMYGEVASIDSQRLRDKAAIDKEIKQVIDNMISIPSGTFQMGSNEISDEKPIHRVSISAFKISQTEVTFAQWDACVSAGGCTYRPSDSNWGRGNRPVTNVSFNDITKQFIPWLNKLTGKNYRLPTEAEWEYSARAGSTSKYSWGNAISCSQVRYGKRSNGECTDSLDGSVSVKSFSANEYGLYDMHGNVWEWTQDCYNNNYQGAPINGQAWIKGDCAIRMLRGGSWDSPSESVRSANRAKDTAYKRYYNYGFRLVQYSLSRHP
jgi:formylglycine-generating enzyme required for sulfatase activity